MVRLHSKRPPPDDADRSLTNSLKLHLMQALEPDGSFRGMADEEDPWSAETVSFLQDAGVPIHSEWSVERDGRHQRVTLRRSIDRLIARQDDNGSWSGDIWNHSKVLDLMQRNVSYLSSTNVLPKLSRAQKVLEDRALKPHLEDEHSDFAGPLLIGETARVAAEGGLLRAADACLKRLADHWNPDKGCFEGARTTSGAHRVRPTLHTAAAIEAIEHFRPSSLMGLLAPARGWLAGETDDDLLVPPTPSGAYACRWIGGSGFETRFHTFKGAGALSASAVPAHQDIASRAVHWMSWKAVQTEGKGLSTPELAMLLGALQRQASVQRAGAFALATPARMVAPAPAPSWKVSDLEEDDDLKNSEKILKILYRERAFEEDMWNFARIPLSITVKGFMNALRYSQQTGAHAAVNRLRNSKLVVRSQKPLTVVGAFERPAYGHFLTKAGREYVEQLP